MSLSERIDALKAVYWSWKPPAVTEASERNFSVMTFPVGIETRFRVQGYLYIEQVKPRAFVQKSFIPEFEEYSLRHSLLARQKHKDFSGTCELDS